MNKTLPLQVASICLAGGRCKHFSHVSSAGANARSMFLYMRIKGEVEQALAGMGFASLALYRPGLLNRGDLASTWQRWACRVLSSMPVARVARAMARRAAADLAALAAARPLPLPRGPLTNAHIEALAAAPWPRGV